VIADKMYSAVGVIGAFGGVSSSEANFRSKTSIESRAQLDRFCYLHYSEY
jgi:hypothetical protein